MAIQLTTQEYWRQAFGGIKLPKITRPAHDVCIRLESNLPKSDKMSLIEIGCAPGGWMAFFNKHFGYSVSGIEYVEELAAITRQNMEMQGIEAEVLNLNFLESELTAASYDIVFSAGFIEHFEDLDTIINKISMMARQYVVTSVPNLYGLRGFVTKVLRPKVFYSHNLIDNNLLRNLHEKHGLDTLFCNYVGGLQLPMLFEDAFFNEKKRYIKHINLPFRLFNLLSRTISKYTHVYPRTKFMSTHLMYIGRKRPNIITNS
jgi:hypothetical protein